MKLSSLLIGFVIAAFMLNGLMGFYSELFDNYNTEGTENISLSENATDIVGDIQDMGDTFRNPQGIADTVGMIITGGYTAITVLLSFPGAMVNSVAVLMAGTPFALPGWVQSIVSGVIWIIFIAIFIHIIFKVKPEA